MTMGLMTVQLCTMENGNIEMQKVGTAPNGETYDLRKMTGMRQNHSKERAWLYH